MLRYVLGDSVGIHVPVLPTEPVLPEPTKIDVRPTIKGLWEEGVELTFPAFDPATHAAPAEVRACFVKVVAGEEAPATPATVDEWLAAPLPCSIARDPIGPEGVETYVLPLPLLERPADYVVQLVLGYDDGPAPAPETEGPGS